jgi:predicted alpha/beta-fold hydrolase
LAVGNGVTGRPAFPHFLERPPWWGGDLQTVRNRLWGQILAPTPVPAEQLEFPTTDGSGDALIASLDRPPAGHRTALPLVILLHGLTGCEDSHYIRVSARHLLARGCPVLRLNLRGAGPSRLYCRREYHAGSTDDLRAVIGRLDGRLAANGIIIVGYSLGGNILLKYLGEQERRASILGAVSVSAPIDLKAAQMRFMHRRNRRNHDHILARMKAGMAAPSSALSDSERASLESIATVYDFDDRAVLPCRCFSIYVCRRFSSMPPMIHGFLRTPISPWTGRPTRASRRCCHAVAAMSAFFTESEAECCGTTGASGGSSNG